MPVCKKCGLHFPNRITIDGKERVLSSRSFCINCSPFGSHNTSQLVEEGERHRVKKQRNADAVKRRRREVKLNAVKYKGGKCSICGYNKCLSALEFHHVDPKSKLFGLSEKGLTRSWDSVCNELDKCILLCSNCHKEVEAGMIPYDIVLKAYMNIGS